MSIWLCIPAACVIGVGSGVVQAYIAKHGPPPACEMRCHWVIPAEEWQPGGMFYRHPPVVAVPSLASASDASGYAPQYLAGGGVGGGSGPGFLIGGGGAFLPPSSPVSPVAAPIALPAAGLPPGNTELPIVVPVVAVREPPSGFLFGGFVAALIAYLHLTSRRKKLCQ